MKNDIIPQGDLIRQLLAKSDISNHNINVLLREKGVFICKNEKNTSVPLIMKSIISPNDFSKLYDSQKSKEETIKYRTASIKCEKDFDLVDLITEDIDINKKISDIHTYKPNYKVIGSPSFFLEDENTAVYKYSIERENFLNDWTNNRTIHEGTFTIKKISSEEVQISIQQDFTSKETQEVNRILMNQTKEIMLNKSIIKSLDDIISVQFNHFDNAHRIKFFYSFAKNVNIYLKFISITDIDLFLDESVISHVDIKVFLDEIENLKLSGKELQNHILLKESKYHAKLIVGSIKLRYKLDYGGIQGLVQLNLGFSDYCRNKDKTSELQIAIDIIFSEKKITSKIEQDIRKKLLEILERIKVESYEKFKIA